MSKTLLYGIIVLVLLAGGWYWYAGQQGAATLNADVYPLYSGAMWGEVQAKETSDGPGYEVVSTPFADITDLAEKFLPFEKYYEEKLTQAGWARDDSRAASGAGANITYYTKDGQFVIVSYHSVFNVQHPDAPSECPCDLTFSLVSGTQVGPTPAEE